MISSFTKESLVQNAG